jgi:hypothetical protein
MEIMINYDPPELMMLVPAVLIGDGEPGEPLPPAVVAIIDGAATAGYWPLDFGACHGPATELIFMRADTVDEARAAAASFIKTGGAV